MKCEYLGTMRNKECPSISIVVPVYNEGDSIPIFLDAMSLELSDIDNDIEILFVDDGSSDSTLKNILQTIPVCEFANIRCVSLSRNFGKEAAVSAGLNQAVGDVVIPMDVDLQDPPSLIKEFLIKWADGYDVIYGLRVSRSTDGVAKKVTSNWFYKLFNRVSPVKIPENAGDFRLMDRRVVDVVNQLPERTRFMKGLFAWVGFRTCSVPFDRIERASGNSKWSYWKLWNFALDGITSFSTIPLRVWTYIGSLLALGAFLYMLFIVFLAIFFDIDAPGYASIMTIMLFLGGIQLITLGIIGEYIGRLFIESKKRPIYIVDQIYDSNNVD